MLVKSLPAKSIIDLSKVVLISLDEDMRVGYKPGAQLVDFPYCSWCDSDTRNGCSNGICFEVGILVSIVDIKVIIIYNTVTLV